MEELLRKQKQAIDELNKIYNEKRKTKEIKRIKKLTQKDIQSHLEKIQSETEKRKLDDAAKKERSARVKKWEKDAKNIKNYTPKYYPITHSISLPGRQATEAKRALDIYTGGKGRKKTRRKKNTRRKPIRINPKMRGIFTKKAKRKGMSVQKYAKYIVKKYKGKKKTKRQMKLFRQALFAKTAKKWKKNGKKIKKTKKTRKRRKKNTRKTKKRRAGMFKNVGLTIRKPSQTSAPQTSSPQTSKNSMCPKYSYNECDFFSPPCNWKWRDAKITQEQIKNINKKGDSKEHGFCYDTHDKSFVSIPKKKRRKRVKTLKRNTTPTKLFKPIPNDSLKQKKIDALHRMSPLLKRLKDIDKDITENPENKEYNEKLKEKIKTDIEEIRKSVGSNFLTINVEGFTQKNLLGI